MFATRRFERVHLILSFLSLPSHDKRWRIYPRKQFARQKSCRRDLGTKLHFIKISGSNIQNGDKIVCGNSALCEAKMSTIDYLKSEVERLNNELQQACLEKVQAAEYGLAVLEEKQRLQEQYDELETSLEGNKQELECLREVNI